MTMTPASNLVDQRIREVMAQLDLAEYPTWPESRRSQALFRLIEFLPLAAFGSREMWHAINDRLEPRHFGAFCFMVQMNV